MRESRFNLVVREKQSENFVLFSKFFFQIFQSVFVCKILMEWSWKNYACCSWHFAIFTPCGVKNLLLLPKKDGLEWRFILEVLQCHSLNLTVYEGSPSPSDLSPFPPTMFICNDLCRARDFTFSLLSACSAYVAPYRYSKINMLQNRSLKVFLCYTDN